MAICINERTNLHDKNVAAPLNKYFVCIEKAKLQIYEIIILMIDMSNAFDTSNRKKEQLEELLFPTAIIVKEYGEWIRTNIGVAQKDCLSVLLFIFYLAHIIMLLRQETAREDHKDEIF